MWCIPEMTDEYVERMLDLVEIYERPYDSDYPVVCFDEKSKQLLGNTREPLPVKSGKPKRIDYEYKRNGTINIFVATEPKGKKRYTFVTKHRKKQDFAKTIKVLVAQKYKSAKKLILITDNLNIHNEKTISQILGDEAKEILSRLEWHYTPKHASWLNMAEIEINALSGQCLRQRIPTFQDMQKQVASWQKDRNKMEVGINWQFTREKAIKKFKLKDSAIHKN